MLIPLYNYYTIQQVLYTLFIDVEIENNGEADNEEDDDVISLPGGPDDELDLEYIADKLELLERPEGMLSHLIFFTAM